MQPQNSIFAKLRKDLQLSAYAPPALTPHSYTLQRSLLSAHPVLQKPSLSALPALNPAPATAEAPVCLFS